MRVAYLMSGLIGGTKGKNSEHSENSLKEKIIQYTSQTHSYIKDNVEIDYFIFSWEPELEKIYQKIYSPKVIKCVPQIIFDVPDHFREHKDNPRVQAHYSRWYGNLEVNNLCQQYSKDNNINYDLVINARLDLCYQNKLNLTELNPNQFNLAKPVNLPNYNWPRNNEMIDHIFISNPDNMHKFLTLYNYLDEYTSPGQCPQWKLISSHFLSVWHLNKLGLLNQDTITDSNISCWDNGYSLFTDYYIFRYKNHNLSN